MELITLLRGACRCSQHTSSGMDDGDTKERLLIQVILGVSEHTRIKTRLKPLVGGPGEPVAEQTKFRWSIMSPWVEYDKGTMLSTQTSCDLKIYVAWAS